jgi:hypothetical protein
MKKTTESSIQYNSSDDSFGEDLSFEEESDMGIGTGIISDMKSKKDQYIAIKNKIYKIKKDIEKNTNSHNNKRSMWTSVYYTFFSNNIADSITLSELNLRCSLLSKCDETEKKSNRGAFNINVNVNGSANANGNVSEQQFPSHANLKEYIDKISSKRRENLFKKLFKRKIQGRNFKTSSHAKPKVSLMLQPAMKDSLKSVIGDGSVIPESQREGNLMTIIKREIKGGGGLGIKNNNSNSHINGSNFKKSAERERSNVTGKNFSLTKSLQLSKSPIAIRRSSNILKAYDIKESPEFLLSLSINRKSENKRKRRFDNRKDAGVPPVDVENIHNILSNKHSFQIELVKISEVKKNCPLNNLRHLLEFHDMEKVFEYNKSSVFKLKSEKTDTFSTKANILCNNILGKIDETNKIEL